MSFTISKVPFTDRDMSELCGENITDLKRNAIVCFKKGHQKIAYLCDDHRVLNPVICGYDIENQSICLHFFDEAIKHHNYKPVSCKQQHQWVTTLDPQMVSFKNEKDAEEDMFTTSRSSMFYLRDDYRLVYAEICGVNDDSSNLLIRFSQGIEKQHMYSTSPDDEYQWLSDLCPKRFFLRICLDHNVFPRLTKLKTIQTLFKEPKQLVKLLNDPNLENAFKVLLDDQNFHWHSARAWNSIVTFLEFFGKYPPRKTMQYLSSIIDKNDDVYDDHHSVTRCGALKRISTRMRDHSSEVMDMYTSSNMVKDFHHLITEHNDDNQFDHIYKTITRLETDIENTNLELLSAGFLRTIVPNEKRTISIFNSVQCIIITYNTMHSECALDSCICMRRNYRDRTGEERTIQDLYETNDQHVMCSTELMDQIHCYYCHSYHLRHRLRPHKTDHPLQSVNTNHSDLVNSNKFQTLVNFEGNTQNTENNYSFGYPYNYYDEPNDWFIPSKYSDIKDELLNNEIFAISNTQFLLLLQRANCFVQSKILYSHFVLQSFHPSHCTNINDKTGIPPYFPIVSRYLIAVMAYCNLDRLQFKFSQTFRKLSSTETDLSLITRHSNYYYLGRLLRECVRMFGTGTESIWNNNRTFYHGINNKLMVPTTIGCKIYCPFSTSSSWPVGVQFAQNGGLVLEIKPFDKEATNPHSIFSVVLENRRRERNDGCTFFDCSLVSIFPSEQEKLFIGGIGTLQFTNIVASPSGTSYKLYLEAIDFIYEVISAYSVRNQGMYPLQRISFDNLSSKQRTLIHRMVYNELHRNGWTKCREFKSCPSYISTLFHKFCQSKTGCIYVFVQSRADTCGIGGFWKSFICQEFGIVNWITVIFSLFPLASRIEIKCDSRNRSSSESGRCEAVDYLSYLLQISQFMEQRDGFAFQGCYRGDITDFRRFYEIENIIHFMKDKNTARCCQYLSLELVNKNSDHYRWNEDNYQPKQHESHN
eukprot:265625_1